MGLYGLRIRTPQGSTGILTYITKKLRQSINNFSYLDQYLGQNLEFSVYILITYKTFYEILMKCEHEYNTYMTHILLKKKSLVILLIYEI